MSSPARIRITIDALMLRGIAPEQRLALVAGLQSELGRLFAAPEAVAALKESRSIESLPLRRMQVAAESSPAQMGALAARHIARGLAS